MNTKVITIRNRNNIDLNGLINDRIERESTTYKLRDIKLTVHHPILRIGNPPEQMYTAILIFDPIATTKIKEFEAQTVIPNEYAVLSLDSQDDLPETKDQWIRISEIFNNLQEAINLYKEDNSSNTYLVKIISKEIFI